MSRAAGLEAATRPLSSTTISPSLAPERPARKRSTSALQAATDSARSRSSSRAARRATALLCQPQAAAASRKVEAISAVVKVGGVRSGCVSWERSLSGGYASSCANR